MIGPGRAAVNPRFDVVVSVMFSQGGKTSGAFNVIGAVMDSRPVPMMYVASSQDQILRVIEPKVDEMLRGCPTLWEKTLQGKKYTAVRKVIAGCALRLAWPTPTQMSADTACIVFVDEIDRIARDIRGEGGIMELADARHNTYVNGRTVGFSSPTEGNIETYIDERTGLEHWRRAPPEQVRSPVWQIWQDGTRFEWSWPCPSCREYFIPRMRLLVFDSEGTLGEIRQSAAVQCPHCDEPISSEAKTWMNSRGVYIAPGQRPKREHPNQLRATVIDFTGDKAWPVERRVDYGDAAVPTAWAGEDATFWVSGLANFSAKKTFGALAVALAKAARSGKVEKTRGVVNTQYGECFAFGGEAPEWKAVKARAGKYQAGELPAPGVLFLTVDVQKRHLVWCLRLWGAGFESWLIDIGEIWAPEGKTVQHDSVWEELTELTLTEYDGQEIEKTAVDSGYAADAVYKWVRKNKGKRYATKGGRGERLFHGQKVDVTRRGQLKKRGSLTLWHLNADQCKQWVHSRMELEPGDPEQWHVYADVPEEYCRQVVGEERAEGPSGKVVWIETYANHWLDCEGMQYFLASKEKSLIRRVKSPRDDDENDEGTSDVTTKPDEPKREIARKPSRTAARRRSGFVRGYRPS